jgi:hypothetical protein
VPCRIALLLAFACCGSWSTVTRAASPHEFTAQLDMRLVAVDTPLDSFTEGGLGLLRFDESHDALRLGNLMLDYTGPLTDTVRATVTLFATGDDDKNPIDLTEAFLEWRPVPTSEWRWRTKLGAFYPPISMENRGIGWQSIYTLSPSAINTWLGEEIRAIGGEVSLTNAGAGVGRPFDFGVVLGVYGWNDPMGILIYQRGWAVHDRQSPLFGRLPRPTVVNFGPPQLEFFSEIDNRAGYYAGLEFAYGQRLSLRALHYDNRGDPGVRNEREYAWLSRFDAFGMRLELPQDWTLIAQYMQGDTAVAPSPDGRGAAILDYSSEFLLVSKAHGRHRWSARYDHFATETVRGAAFYDSWQDGQAWTLAWFFDLSDRWQFVAEGLRNDSRLRQRSLAGLSPDAIEDSLQIAVRYTLSNH